VIVGKSAGRTDPGRKRRRNEDAFVLAPPLFAIADGMGGAQAGEVASKLAAAALEESDHGQLRGEDGVAELIQEANRRVHERSTADPSTSGMGTTMTVALVENGNVVIGHVGDSRAYRVRDGHLEQLTEDHSLVNELLKSGKLSPEEAEVHPQRSVITRAVGTDPDVDVDTFTVAAEEGDVFLLCSDGLTDMVSDTAIRDLVQEHRSDLERAARALVDAANSGGGEDNITVVAFEIVPGSAEELEETVRMEAPAADAADDEDTLSGLEAVPAVDTMVVRPDEVERLGLDGVQPARTPQRERSRADRGARLRLVLAMLLMLAIVTALVVWGLLR
jgi:protein phosphatase